MILGLNFSKIDPRIKESNSAIWGAKFKCSRISRCNFPGNRPYFWSPRILVDLRRSILPAQDWVQIYGNFWVNNHGNCSLPWLRTVQERNMASNGANIPRIERYESTGLAALLIWQLIVVLCGEMKILGLPILRNTHSGTLHTEHMSKFCYSKWLKKAYQAICRIPHTFHWKSVCLCSTMAARLSKQHLLNIVATLAQSFGHKQVSTARQDNCVFEHVVHTCYF